MMVAMRNNFWMAVGLVAGLIVGLVAAATQSEVLLGIMRALRPVGTLFLNLLSMCVIPLVAGAVFSGVAGLGDLRQVGRLGVKTLSFFWGTALVAIVIGFLVSALVLPLAPIPAEQQAMLRAMAGADTTIAHRAAELPSGVSFLVELVPRNPVRAAADGSLLPFVVFVVVMGVAAATLPETKRRPLTDLADGLTLTMIRIVHWVLLLAPLGIFALVGSTAAQFGWSLVRAMLVFVLALIVGLALLIAAVLVPLAVTLGRHSPRVFLRTALPSMTMGFSTTSSLASLPVMLEAADQLRLPRRVSGFVLPFGASINRPGSALYQTVAVCFVVALYGLPFGAMAKLEAAAAVFLASLSVASVPSASIVSMAPAFLQLGLPRGGLSLLIGLDRIPDMFRTMTNVTGHVTAAAAVAGPEREPT
jgi:Na+/H+-dicarboxylate symporter